jgi:hypothetical protein
MLDDDIFSNPMIQAAKKALSKEDRERYAKLGEELFKNIDFEKCNVDNIPPIMEESIMYIESMLKSGLHPSMLNDDEKFILKDVLGEKWYEKYGYVKEDLDDIVTLKIN